MKIVAREQNSFRITCPNGHDFTAPRHSISVECPACGATGSTRELVDRMIKTAERQQATAA